MLVRSRAGSRTSHARVVVVAVAFSALEHRNAEWMMLFCRLLMLLSIRSHCSLLHLVRRECGSGSSPSRSRACARVAVVVSCALETRNLGCKMYSIMLQMLLLLLLLLLL